MVTDGLPCYIINGKEIYSPDGEFFTTFDKQQCIECEYLKVGDTIYSGTVQAPEIELVITDEFCSEIKDLILDRIKDKLSQSILYGWDDACFSSEGEKRIETTLKETLTSLAEDQDLDFCCYNVVDITSQEIEKDDLY